MAKVKVYELAKELNIGSKEIISFLSENNIKVTSHMNNLEDSSIELVKSKYVKKETKTITKPETEPKAKEEKQKDLFYFQVCMRACMWVDVCRPLKACVT